MKKQVVNAAKPVETLADLKLLVAQAEGMAQVLGADPDTLRVKPLVSFKSALTGLQIGG